VLSGNRDEDMIAGGSGRDAVCGGAGDDLPSAGAGLDGVGRLMRFAGSQTGKPEGMARYVELRRHTDSDGDALTAEGIRAALDIGQGLAGRYQLRV
jgi:RTX calcium-binding nonapeptide repeat (4 copies)